MGRYKSEYPDSYREGTVNRSFSISKVAHDLLDSNEIGNQSGFVNDLIIDALQEKDFFKRKLVASLNANAEELRKRYGVNVNLEVRQ